MLELIIWDYNGTVVDDADTSVAAVNEMLSKRGLPPTDKKAYTENIKMPLDLYYQTVGIHNADISTLSIEFRKMCLKNEHLSKIFDDFYGVITASKKLGIINILMSSLYEEFLLEEVDKFGIKKYFDDIIGMKDTGVGSKVENAKKYLKESGISPQNTLFIGDLISDAQMAEKIGAKCILIPRGHCSKQRCLQTNTPVFDTLEKAWEHIVHNYN